MSCWNARLMGERILGTSFQKSTVATARLAIPSGVNSNFYKSQTG
jgi:hypothetical protein